MPVAGGDDDDADVDDDRDEDDDIQFNRISKGNPRVLAEYIIDISQQSIKAYVETNTENFSTYTKIVIDLKDGADFNDTILLDSSNFIENTISDTEPNQTMTSVSTIEMNIIRSTKNIFIKKKFRIV